MICQVYEAEKVVTRTRVYHRSCLACSVCSRGLEAATATEAGDGRVYCRGCYSRHCCTTLYCTLHQHYAHPRQFCSLASHRYGARAGVRAGAQEAGCARCGDKVFSVDQVHHLQHVTCTAPGAGGGGPGPAVPPPVPLLRHLRHPAHPRQPQPRPGRGHPLREVLQRQVTVTGGRCPDCQVMTAGGGWWAGRGRPPG